MHWDMDKESRIQQAINEYRLSSNSYDYTLSDDELVDDAISNIKISQGQTYLNNEQELRKLIRAKIKRARKHDDEMLKIIRKKVDDEEREKDAVANLLREQLSHKNGQSELLDRRSS